jgi:hypothetical protein
MFAKIIATLKEAVISLVADARAEARLRLLESVDPMCGVRTAGSRVAGRGGSGLNPSDDVR